MTDFFDERPNLLDIAIEESLGSYTRMGSHYSATELLHSPRLTLLRRRYEDLKPKANMANSWASFKGNAMHNEMKKGLWRFKSNLAGKDPDLAKQILVEYRVFDKILGRRLSGQADVVWGSKLFDYKTKRAWAKPYFYKQMDAWEMQLNIYSYLLSEYNITIKEAYILVMYLDWNQKFTDNPKYPNSEQEYIKLPVWSYDKQDTFVHSSLSNLIIAEALPDDDLPVCTDADTWTDVKYGALKAGNKRATRSFTDIGACNKFIDTRPPTETWDVKITKSEPTFCEKFCWCADFCSQAREYKEEHDPKKKKA